MENKKTVKEVIKVAVILFAITAIAAAILAAVNMVTAPVIAENDRKAQDEAILKVLPNASELCPITTDGMVVDGVQVTETVYRSDVGYAVGVAPNGYGGPITMIVGVDNDLKVTGIKIISQSETAGLGAKCTEESFQEQYKGKTENIVVSKSGAKDNEIDAISSATVTSKAVTKGVNRAISIVKAVKEAK